MRHRFLSCALSAALLLVRGTAAPAQQAESAAGDVPLLRTQTRLVLEDVLVLDAKGNPVHGLPASAFHVFDNNHPQTIRDLTEGAPSTPVQQSAALPLGTFSNRPVGGAARATEVLLLDTDNTPLLDQMFLLKQLQTAVRRMPADLPVMVVSVTNGRALPLLTAPSTDRAALRHALTDAMPVQNHVLDSVFHSAENTLLTVAAYLQQTPGPKNLLWFASHFPLVSVTPGEENAGGNYTEREHEIHLVHEALSEARIAVFPVDPRGVLGTLDADVGTPAGVGTGAGRDPRSVNAASQRREVGAPGANDTDRRSEMRRIAAATGGRAYSLNNLADEITQAFDLSRAAYTLSYVPNPYALDQSWHGIHIEVDGGYQLSYRRGYLATFIGGMGEPERTKLVRGGELRRADPNVNRPILFQVHLEPGQQHHVSLSYAVPLSETSMLHRNGAWTGSLIVTTYAYDVTGRVRDGKRQQLDTHLSDAAYAEAQKAGRTISTRQQMQVPRGARYLLCLVRDPESQRTGSVVLRTEVLDALQREPAATEGSPPGAAPGTPGAEPARPQP